MALQSMSEWRSIVLERDGYQCVLCTTVKRVIPGAVKGWRPTLEAHHVWYRSMGGHRVDPRNGVTLCGEHHHQVHARSVLIPPEALTDETREYLAEHRVVDWDEHGEPFGTMMRGFAPRSNMERKGVK